MKKRLFLICIVFLFGGVFVLGGGASDNDMVLKILGCTGPSSNIADLQSSSIFVNVGGCLDDRGYCASSGDLWDVRSEPNACTFGKTILPSDPLDVCCSLTYNYCTDEIVAGEFLCVPRTQSCPDYTDEDNCLLYQCFWDEYGVADIQDGVDDGTGLCLTPANSCDSYTTAVSCSEDVQGVATSDPNCVASEYESGGVWVVVNRESCECVNDDVRGCGVSSEYLPVFPEGDEHSFCYKYTEVDNCTGGFEDYRIIAVYNSSTMPISGLNLADIGCVNKSGRRRCGEEIVKVPFFNFFNVVFVLLLIAIVYLSVNKISVLNK